MGTTSDLTGNKYGLWTVIKRSKNSNTGKTKFLCICDCGQERDVLSDSLINGKSTSCGCYRNSVTIPKMISCSTTHGLSKHPLFTRWANIIGRCYTKTDRAYERYGGRGIQVCDEWRYDFKSFYDWCIKNNWEHRLCVDRFPDNNGNYSPDNCRITTVKMNNNNKGNHRYATLNGVTKNAAQWSGITGILSSTISLRIRKGLEGYEAIYGTRAIKRLYSTEKQIKSMDRQKQYKINKKDNNKP